MINEIKRIRAEKMMKSVRDALNYLCWKFDERKDIIMVRTVGDDNPFGIMIKTDDEKELLQFITFFEKTPDESFFEETAILVSKMNAVTPIGAFTLNKSRGAVGFQIICSYCQSVYDPGAIIEMLVSCCYTIDGANDLFTSFFEGKSSIDEVLKIYEGRIDDWLNERDGDKDYDEEKSEARANFEIICSALDSISYRYDKNEKDLNAYFFVTGDDTPIEMLFEADAYNKVLRLTCGLDVEFAEVKTGIIAQACCYATGRCTNGSFFIDENEVCFKIETPYAGSLLHNELALYMLNAASDLCDHFNDSFKMLSDGDMMLDEFCEL